MRASHSAKEWRIVVASAITRFFGRAMPMMTLVLLAACGANREANLVIVTMPNLAGGLGVNLDVASIYDASLLSELSQYSSSDWFANRESMQSSYPESLHIASWQLVPDSLVVSPAPWRRDEAVGVMVFIDYIESGHNALNITALAADMDAIEIRMENSRAQVRGIPSDDILPGQRI